MPPMPLAGGCGVLWRDERGGNISRPLNWTGRVGGKWAACAAFLPAADTRPHRGFAAGPRAFTALQLLYHPRAECLGSENLGFGAWGLFGVV